MPAMAVLNMIFDQRWWRRQSVCVCTEGRPAVVVTCTGSGADSENVGALERNGGRGRRRRQYPDAAERQSRDCIGRASYYVVEKSRVQWVWRDFDGWLVGWRLA